MAALQPDFHVLSNSLKAAGNQVSLLPNLPAVDHERYLGDQFTAFRQGMDEQFRVLRAQLETRFEQVNTRFADLELSTKAE